MNIKDWFLVGVRIVGLVCCLRGGEDFVWFMMTNLGYNTSVTADGLSHIMSLVIGLFYFFAGLYLLRGAPLLPNFAFPEKTIVPEINFDETAENTRGTE